MRQEQGVYYFTIAYKVAFIILMMLSAVPFVHEIISPYIRIILVPGILLVLYDLALGGRKLWKAQGVVILVLFAVSYGITILINRELHFVENAKALLYMGIIFLALYGFDPQMSKERKTMELRIVLSSVVIATFILSSICFFTYLFSYNLTYMDGETPMHIGMYDNRLWGLYNPNTGATLNVMSVMISLIFWESCKTKKILVRTLLGINMAVQIMCLILTHSRAPILIGIGGIAVYIFFAFARFEGWRKKGRRYGKAALVGILTFALLMVSGNILRSGLSYLPSIITEAVDIGKPDQVQEPEETSGETKKNEAVAEKEKSVETSPKKVDLARKETEEERAGGLLTGRVDLWQAGVQGFLKAPVFGVSRENIYDSCQQYLKDKIWQSSLDVGGLHNIYLTVLVSSGAVGFTILAVFIILTLKKFFRYGFRNKGLEENVYFRGIVLLLAQFAGMEMMEARILYRVGIFYVFFFLIYGYAMYFVQKDEEENKMENI